MSIWFNCKKCGEALAASERKAGFCIACPKCQAGNKIPGIAMQAQATKEQIEQLQTQLKRHRQAIWALLVFLILGIGVLLFSVSNSSTMSLGVDLIGVGLLVGITIVVLVPILKSCEYLGISKVINILLFFFLSVVWVIICIILYMKLKKRIALLKMAEVRGDEI